MFPSLQKQIILKKPWEISTKTICTKPVFHN